MSQAALCRSCLEHPASFDRALAPMRLEGVIRHWVHELKYKAKFQRVRLLGDLMSEALIDQEAPIPDLLIPVPIHVRRRVVRGYNQSLELARHLGRRLAVPVAADAARMTRQPSEQIGQNAAQRQKNLRGVFVVERDLSGLHVAIIDDVMTTGATLDALARAVRKAGADQVSAWAMARTP